MKIFTNRRGAVVADAIDLFVMVVLAFFAFMFFYLVLVKSTAGDAEITQVKTTENTLSVLYGVRGGFISREVLGENIPSPSDDLTSVSSFNNFLLSGEASILKRNVGGARVSLAERDFLGKEEEQHVSEYGGTETPETTTGRSKPAEGIPMGETIKKIAEEEWSLWEKGAKTETEMVEKVLSYYKAGGCYFSTIDVSEVPWSAAFISYIAREAYSELPQSCAHLRYFNGVTNNPNHCITLPIIEVENIKEGDILCQCRGKECQLSYESLPEFASAHCDIVVEKGESSLKVIGGNLGNSVKKVTVNLEKLKNPPYFGFISCEDIS